MADYEQRNNSGTLGRNKNKIQQNHPDHRGSCIIDGVEYWVSAWIKQNNSTQEKFFSLAFTKKDAPPLKESRTNQPGDSNDFDDDIPF